MSDNIIGTFKYTEPPDKFYEEPSYEITLTVKEARYTSGGNLAVELESDLYGPYARLSTNVPGLTLEKDQFVVPSYNLSQELLKACLDSEFFEDTGQRVDVGFAKNQPIWRLKK